MPVPPRIYEIPPAPGTTDLIGPTYNPATGKLKSWLNVDGQGNVSSPVFAPAGGSSILTARVTITAAQLRSAVPVQIVAAPGVGNYHILLNVFYNFKFIAPVHTVAAGQIIQVISGAADSGSWNATDAGGFIDFNSDRVLNGVFIAGSGAVGWPTQFPNQINLPSAASAPEAGIDNKAIQFKMSAALTGTGNGTLDIIVVYMTVAKA